MVACTSVGCTKVLSEPFETSNIYSFHLHYISCYITEFFPPLPPPPLPSSILWVIVFPLLAIVIVAGLATYKRKSLKRLINQKFIKSGRYEYNGIFYLIS
jgi:hypothetical protein